MIRQSVCVKIWRRTGWSFEAARVPATFSAAHRPGEDSLEHAAGHLTTLCGIPMREVAVYRHLFRGSKTACSSCRDEAAKAPTQPCVQEKLHNVLNGVEGPLCEELREALRAGAKVPFWVTGSAASMMKHYVMLEQNVDGREEAASIEDFNGGLGVARVATAKRRFLVLIPEDATPVIAVEKPNR